MTQQDMLDRTRTFAVRIVRMVSALPSGRVGDVLGKQALRSGTSIGANYCEAVSGSSRKQFIAILEIVQREARETNYWLDVIRESKLVKPELLTGLAQEANELLAIITATIKTAKRRRNEGER